MITVNVTLIPDKNHPNVLSVDSNAHSNNTHSHERWNNTII